jgi:hypothetical protein
MEALPIIKEWLEGCNKYRKLDFNINYLVNNALINSTKTGYKPMKLETVKDRYVDLFYKLRVHETK